MHWLVALDRPPVGDRPRVDDTVTGTELDDVGSAGELEVEPSLEEVEDDVAGTPRGAGSRR